MCSGFIASPPQAELEAATRMTKVELFEAHEMSECVCDVNAGRELDASFAFMINLTAAHRDTGSRDAVPTSSWTRAGRSPQTGEPVAQKAIMVLSVQPGAVHVVGPLQ